MQREPRLRPADPYPTNRAKWLLPALLIGGSVLAIFCAIVFVVGAVLWDPAKPAAVTVAPPTPGGSVVRFVTVEPGSQPEQQPTPIPGASEPTLVPSSEEATPTPEPVETVEANTEETGEEEDEPEEEPTKAPPAPSAPVSDAFAYGIQVDPSGSPEEIIANLNELGITWVKFQISWKDTEPEQGVRNWGEWDRLILTYHNAGFNILLSVPKAPDWARPSNTDFSQEGPPADPATYAQFVGEMCQRYKGGVQAVEVWNEQNLAREGGGAPMPAQDYVTLLSAAYQSIKAADSSIIVVSGALTPAGDVPGAAIDDITYLNSMYAAGLKNVSDAIGAHPSGYNCPADGDWQVITNPSATFRGPFDNRHHSWCFRGTMEGYREVMVANGDTNKKIWPTEFGWAVSSSPPANYEYAGDNTRQQQAEWIVSAFQQAKAWGWVGPMFLWNLNYGVTLPGSEQAVFSILTPEGPTPAYQALAGLTK
jgi:hypothetical protein